MPSPSSVALVTYIALIHVKSAHHDSRGRAVHSELVSCVKELVLAHSLRVGMIDHSIPGQAVHHTTQHLQTINMQYHYAGSTLLME